MEKSYKNDTKYGNKKQTGLSLIYKLAQSGKTGEAIVYLKSCEDFFCFVLTENSSNLLVQTKDRIEIALDKSCMRVDGKSNETRNYNIDIFSVCPKDPTKLRGKICMVIKNKVNIERMAVLQHEIDNHNINNPLNQVHYKIIADEVDKTMSLTSNVIDNSKLVQRIISESKIDNRKLSNHREYPRRIDPLVDYCFNINIHPGLIKVLGLTATTSDLYTNEGIKKVFGNGTELAIKTNVIDISTEHRDVSKWEQILIKDEIGFEKSIENVINKCGEHFNNQYYMFLPAMMKNTTHIKVAKQAHEIDPEILVISVNQCGVVGRIKGDEKNDFIFINHKSSFNNETLAVKISDIISKTKTNKIIVTGYISLCRGVTIQAKKHELREAGVKTKRNNILKHGLIMNCIGVHENIKIKKLGQNADLIQRLCRGNGYPCPNYTPKTQPKIIGCERILKAFHSECEFINTCMEEGKETGITTDTNFKRIKEKMEKLLIGDDENENVKVDKDLDISIMLQKFEQYKTKNTCIARFVRTIRGETWYTKNKILKIASDVGYKQPAAALHALYSDESDFGLVILHKSGNKFKLMDEYTDIHASIYGTD